ncbi:hypothetical protein NL676_026938 [Syzygium grande]|nr:hypothetical protein NL676_026938 [Syzygium grande]
MYPFSSKAENTRGDRLLWRGSYREYKNRDGDSDMSSTLENSDLSEPGSWLRGHSKYLSIGASSSPCSHGRTMNREITRPLLQRFEFAHRRGRPNEFFGLGVWFFYSYETAVLTPTRENVISYCMAWMETVKIIKGQGILSSPRTWGSARLAWRDADGYMQ